MQTELSSFLIEITALIFKKKDEDGKSYILDSILDKTGMKGTGLTLAPAKAACSAALQALSGSCHITCSCMTFQIL